MHPMQSLSRPKHKQPKSYLRYLDLRSSINKSRKRRCVLQVYSFAVADPEFPLAHILLPYSIVASRCKLEQFISDHRDDCVAVRSVNVVNPSQTVTVQDGVVIYLPDYHLRREIARATN